MPRTREEVARRFHRIFVEEIMPTRESGQKEYAHDADNAFANFERTAELLGVPPELVLLTFLLKHMDGITTEVRDGYASQRESIFGRITDAIVYLMLLWCMIEDKNDHGQGLSGFEGFVEGLGCLNALAVEDAIMEALRNRGLDPDEGELLDLRVTEYPHGCPRFFTSDEAAEAAYMARQRDGDAPPQEVDVEAPLYVCPQTGDPLAPGFGGVPAGSPGDPRVIEREELGELDQL